MPTEQSEDGRWIDGYWIKTRQWCDNHGEYVDNWMHPWEECLAELAELEE